jgi:hypothetical protein
VPPPLPMVSEVISLCNINNFLANLFILKVINYLFDAVPTRITFTSEPNKSTQPEELSMEVDDNNTDVESKKQIVSPIKPPESSTIIAHEEDSGFENMEVDEPKDCNFQESIRRKRPLEAVSFFYLKNKIIVYIYLFICIF